jgi:U2-associated protein SR140
MSESSKIREFPDISSKLTAPPTRKSLFERQKAEAEAKRAREKAETAAVYEDFVKSFDHDDGNERPSAGRGEVGGRLGGSSYGGGGLVAGGMSKRHFTSGPGRASGPGSLGPAFGKKRNFEGESVGVGSGRRDNTLGLFAFENSAPGSGPLDPAAAFGASDDEEEKVADSKAMDKAAAKPTLHLSSLPPGTSPAVIKSLIPSILTVENVKILPTSSSGSGERKSSSAIVTLAKDTPATDIDTAVNSVQNRYLGWGYNLSISRYLSSAAVNAGIPVTTGAGSMNSLPFGARSVPQAGGSLSRAPPPGIGRGFAPPSSYTIGSFNRTPATQVTVNPPSDLKQLRLIHKTLESLLTYGPEFEALLMSRPDVQKEEKWSWLWNSRSPGGVWYRWRLWDIITSSQRRAKTNLNRNAQIFEGGAAWVPPETGLEFEYTTQLDEFVSDSEYNSSDDDSDAELDRRRHREHRQQQPIADPLSTDNAEEHSYLNPLQKAKLTHLLARLPPTNAKLRKGDVARVTAFAIEHAGEGADEVVEMIVSNVDHPYSYTAANPDYRPDNDSANPNTQKFEDKDGVVATPEDATNPTKPSEKDPLDTSPAQLIALYLISDILSTSSTSGIRHAWRYRSLFESSLKAHSTFAKLGRLEKELRWGRLKAEKWRRSVMSVLSLWEGWCVFPVQTWEGFVEVFNKPPLTEKERREEEEEKRKVEAEKEGVGRGKSRWRAVDENDGAVGFGEVKGEERMDVDVDGAPIPEDEVDGAPIDEDDVDGVEMEDLDGVPMEDSDDEGNLDGEGMDGVDHDGLADGVLDTRAEEGRTLKAGVGGDKGVGVDGSPGTGRKRQRMKAEDMFADSDEE